jgi:tRNA(fMet)-specific endonuclease VapC
MFALDTNTVIYLFKGEGQVAKRLERLSLSQVAIPSPVIFELETGIGKSSAPQKRRRLLDELVAGVAILPFGFEEARIAAALRVSLEKAGTPISPLDLLIAGIVVRHRAVLVTRNSKEFGRIPGLMIENWYD